MPALSNLKIALRKMFHFKQIKNNKISRNIFNKDMQNMYFKNKIVENQRQING